MTLFEFLTVAVSIVLALGIVRLVEGLGDALNAGSRYWVHLILVVSLIVTHLFYWWSLWIFREGVTWNFGSFIFVILGALVLYSAATALIPRDSTAVRSWKEHYFRVHRRLFLVAAVFPAHGFLALVLLRGRTPPISVCVAAIGGIGLNLVGAFSESERVHKCLAAAIGMFVLFFSTLWAQAR